jgi:hypothetical protein
VYGVSQYPEMGDPPQGGLRSGGQRLHATIAPDLAGDQRRDDDRGGGGEHSRQPQRDDRSRGEPVHERGQQGRQRRLISRSPIEVVTADGQHVHLVEPVSAADTGDELRRGDHRRDRENGTARERVGALPGGRDPGHRLCALACGHAPMRSSGRPGRPEPGDGR